MPSTLPPPIVPEAFRLARRPLTPEESRRLAEFGRFARDELERIAYEVDRRARPRLEGGTAGESGAREVVLAPEHARALDGLYASGVAMGPITQDHDWPFTFALMHEVADVGCLCSATVTLATAYSLRKWGSASVRDRFLPPMVELGGRAQGATWATEEQGGSDLGSNRSHAARAEGERWSLTGEKFFCSNVGASAAVVTARADGGPPGVRGVRLFFVPARREDGSANWQVMRLKDKLGTVLVPTGEVRFDGAEAYALGSTGEGVFPVMEMLNLSRVANAVGSAAVLRRSFELATDYARRRSAFGKAIAEHPLLALDLATLAAEADAASLLAFDSAFRFGRSAEDKPPYSAEFHLARFTTHAAKLVTAEQAVRGAALAMEVFGGVGYLEEYPLAKLLRDALVTPIWEGGANLQALDARELMQRHHPESSWQAAAGRAAARSPSEEVRRFLSLRITALGRLTDEAEAKRTLRAWGELRQMTLLVALARRSETPRVYEARAELFARLRSGKPVDRLPPTLIGTALGEPA